MQLKNKLLYTIILSFIMFYNLAKAQAPSWSWAKTSGGSSGDIALSVVADDSGNFIVVGYFMSATITFGNITLSNANTGLEDIYIVKYNYLGNVVWAKSTGGINSDVATSIASDASGNLIVVGYFSSPTITFGLTTLNNTNTKDDIFIVKYDKFGNVLWAISEGGNDTEDAYSVSVDAASNILVTGEFNSQSFTIGSTTLINSTNIGSSDFFIIKYDSNGTSIWAKSEGGIDMEQASSVITDDSGNVILAGNFSSYAITFGTTTLINTNSGSRDVFIIKYSPIGNVLWAKSVAGSSIDYATAVASDSQGNLIITGVFKSPVLNFGSIALTNSSSNDLFLAKYDPSGNIIWAKSAKGGKSFSVIVDASSNLTVAGGFIDSTITFGSITLINSNAGDGDIFITKFDSAGNELWALSSGGTNSDFATSLTADTLGNLVVTGIFNSPTIPFGTLTFNNAGGNDMFIVNLGTLSSIEELQKITTIKVAPNPFSTLTTISFSKVQINTTIKIIDVFGKEIKVFNFTGQQFIFEKEVLQPGLYFIQAIDENKYLSVTRIIII